MPEKQQEFERVANNKSPVKLKRYSTSDKYDNIAIEKNTQVVEAPPQPHFPRKDINSNMTISSLHNATSNQRVTITAHLT